MTKLKNTINNMTDKVKGESAEAVGKITGNQELELKGKMLSAKVDLKKKVGGLKEGLVEKINDKIDQHEEHKNHNTKNSRY
ncbi:MAG: CsbD family protein [Vallitaleaceae bacterium]|nr:CsbD family protein [Vallitaleaceae bacterium]